MTLALVIRATSFYPWGKLTRSSFVHVSTLLIKYPYGVKRAQSIRHLFP